MIVRTPSGACLALAVLSLVSLVGCKHKERYDEQTSTPVRGDPSLGVTIEMNGAAIAKPSNGDLSVPLRVHNDRQEPIHVSFKKCEVELTNGNRCHCRDDEDVTIAAGGDEEFRLLFGDHRTAVSGASFRVYVWIEGAKGLIDYIPPLVIEGGGGAFAFPARPFSNDPSTGRPLEQEFPPPAGPNKTADPPPVKNARCASCGELCPMNATVCPNCGTARGGQ